MRNESVARSVIRRGEQKWRGKYKLDGSIEVLLLTCGLKHPFFILNYLPFWCDDKIANYKCYGFQFFLLFEGKYDYVGRIIT